MTRAGAGLTTAILLLGVPGASAAQSAWSWPTYQANQEHSGYLPISLQIDQFEQLWSLPAWPSRLNPVVAAEGMVFVTPWIYFTAGDQLLAIDARRGEILWSKNFGSVFSVNSPAVAYGNVYLQTGSSIPTGSPPLFRAFAAATGDFVLQREYPAQWERHYSPTIVDGIAYANGGTYGGLIAFDAHAPIVHWETPLNQYDEWTPAVDDLYAYAYTGLYEPRLSIIERSSGAEVRSIADPGFVWNGWSMQLAPVLGGADDVIVIQAQRLISFDLLSDTIRYQIDGAPFEGQPSVGGGRIFALASGALTVWDERTGAFLWSWAPTQEPLTGTILVTKTHVLTRSATHTFAIDQFTHAEVWSIPVSGQLAWSEGLLFLAGEDGFLTAVRAPAQIFADGFESGTTSHWLVQ